MYINKQERFLKFHINLFQAKKVSFENVKELQLQDVYLNETSYMGDDGPTVYKSMTSILSAKYTNGEVQFIHIFNDNPSERTELKQKEIDALKSMSLEISNFIANECNIHFYKRNPKTINRK
jgi:hypothetical protein